MSLGDIKFLRPGAFSDIGSRTYAVAAGTTASINAGEPVAKTLGAATVFTAGNNTPAVGTDFYVGISATTSTETASAAGTVEVLPLVSGVVYMCAPLTAATWDTQAEYDALVGDRVTFSKASGVYKVNATDGSTFGLVVESLDIKKYPGMVAFSIREAVNYTA